MTRRVRGESTLNTQRSTFNAQVRSGWGFGFTAKAPRQRRGDRKQEAVRESTLNIQLRRQQVLGASHAASAALGFQRTTVKGAGSGRGRGGGWPQKGARGANRKGASTSKSTSKSKSTSTRKRVFTTKAEKGRQEGQQVYSLRWMDGVLLSWHDDRSAHKSATSTG